MKIWRGSLGVSCEVALFVLLWFSSVFFGTTVFEYPRPPARDRRLSRLHNEPAGCSSHWGFKVRHGAPDTPEHDLTSEQRDWSRCDGHPPRIARCAGCHSLQNHLPRAHSTQG